MSLFAEAMKLVEEACVGNESGQGGLKRTAECDLHASTIGSHCPLTPGLPEGAKGVEHMNISGITCYDWSLLGARKGWLGDGCISTLTWAMERLNRQERILIVECVPQIDEQTLAHLVASVYDMSALVCCPSMMGYPIRRKRKYIFFLKRGRWLIQIIEGAIRVVAG